MSDTSKGSGPRKNLEELKKKIADSQPVYVDSSGRLSTPEEEAARQKVNSKTGPNAAGTTKLKDNYRWF